MDLLVKIFKALGDRNRLRIVKMLQQRALCVCEITSVLQLATSTVSKHLSILRDAGIISDSKDGKWVEYNLKTNSNNIFNKALISMIKTWLNNDAQIKIDREKLKSADRAILCN